MGINKEKLVLFRSTYHSIKAEKILTEADIRYRMAAVPPEISSDCGSAISSAADLQKLKDLFAENNILVEAIYEFKNENGKKNFKKVYSRD